MGYIDIAAVSFALPDGRPLLDEVSFRVGEGSTTALIGQNGAGKTTLLRIVRGEVPPLSGAVSIDGGRYPRWARDGKELFYVNLNGAMMAVPISLSPELEIGSAVKLFDWSRPASVITARPYDVSPIDGRFLMSRPVSASALPPISISVVINWFAELRTLLPG